MNTEELRERPSRPAMALVVLVATVGAATIGGFFSRAHPLIEALANGRLQLMLLGALLALACWLCGRRAAAAISVAVLVINGLSVVPYLLPSNGDPMPAIATDVFRVMQYNVWFGNGDIDAIAQHVRDADADVVVLHELTSAQWSELEARLVSEYRYAEGVPLDEEDGDLGGGMAVLTRTAATRRVSVPAEVSPPDRVLMAVVTEVADGEEVLILGLHPHASRHERHKVDLRGDQLAGVVDLASGWDGPAVVVTDMNVTPTSPVYQDLLDDLGWRDPHRTVGWKSSWPSWGGWFGLPIDHVLVSDDIALHGYTVGSGAGSDHKSLTAEISLRR